MAGIYIFSGVLYAVDGDLLKSAAEGDFAGVEKAIAQGVDINATEANGYTALMFAVIDLRSLKAIVAAGADVNRQDNLGWTALMGAAEMGRSDTLNYLLGHGARVDLQNRFGHSALIRAAMFHQPHIVRSLIAAKANLNLRDKSGKSALDYARTGEDEMTLRLLENAGAELTDEYVNSYLIAASGHGHAERVRVLAARCRDIQGETGRRSLLAAAREGRVEIIRLLKSYGQSLQPQGTDETEILHKGIAAQNRGMIDFLLDSGMDVNAKTGDETTPIMVAVSAPANYAQNDSKELRRSLRDSLALAKYLVRRGADLNAVNKAGETALSRAIDWRAFDLVKYLIANGAKTEIGNPLLLQAVAAGDLETLKLLLKMGANPNIADGEKKTALMQRVNAAYQPSDEEEKRFVQMAKILVRYGANVNARSDNDSTPLIEAVRNDNIPLVKYLLSQKANIHAVYPGGTALNEAAEGGNLVLVKLLLARGAKINSKADGGHTPLISAAQQGHEEVVEYLIKSGANLNARTVGRPPCTALEWARHFKREKVAKLLQSAGAK